jgi:CIC family chloride channel protein
MLAAVTGAVTGLLVAGFDRLVVDVFLENIWDGPLWLVGGAPAVGLVLSTLIRRYGGPRSSPSTADEYLHSFHERDHALPFRPFAARMAASAVTLGSGAPMGLEGPSIYTGAFIGNWLQRRLPRAFRGADRRVLLTAGAAAGVAAIFKAPATGAVFGLEVPYQDDLARRMLLPALVSSACGYLAFAAINGTDPLFPITGEFGFRLRDVVGAAVVGAIAGVGARLFAFVLRRAKDLQGRRPGLLTAVLAGAVLGGLFVIGRLMTGESLLVGPGYDVVQWVSEPDRSVWVLLALLAARCLATATVVAGGGAGGLFVPLVVAGATTGAVIGNVVDQSELTLFIVIGVAAFLGAGYRVPLAAVMFVAETTGRPSFVVPGLLAAVAAELVMGHSSVTTYQRGSSTTVDVSASP